MEWCGFYHGGRLDQVALGVLLHENTEVIRYILAWMSTFFWHSRHRSTSVRCSTALVIERCRAVADTVPSLANACSQLL